MSEGALDDAGGVDELHVSGVQALAQRARDASRRLATLPTGVKDALLLDVADRLLAHAPAVLAANAQDMAEAQRAGLPVAKLQRLSLTRGALEQLAAKLREVAALPDPVGRVTASWRAPSGLEVRRVRCPLGVICMIYEARPGVTVEAFALCFKSGNSAILKGGKEAAFSNRALSQIVAQAIASKGLPQGVMSAVTTSDRDVLLELLQQRETIDLVIPRGGEALIRWVAEHSRIPTIQHYKGVCHVYVDAEADLELAARLSFSGKTSAPATCNATECVLVHRDVADRFVPALVLAMTGAGVQVRGCPRTMRIAIAAGAGGAGASDGTGAVIEARPDDFGREFLDLIVAVKVVDSLSEGIAHIDRYGSNHTEAIVTQDQAAADQFLARVQAGCTLHNASTRMNDGYALGLGAEVGISTTRLHAYGAMGLDELTTQRFIGAGTGQVR